MPVWPPTGEITVPLFTLYDYSFRPDNVALSDVVRWAVDADEDLIPVAVLLAGRPLGSWQRIL